MLCLFRHCFALISFCLDGTVVYHHIICELFAQHLKYTHTACFLSIRLFKPPASVYITHSSVNVHPPESYLSSVKPRISPIPCAKPHKASKQPMQPSACWKPRQRTTLRRYVMQFEMEMRSVASLPSL